MNDTEFKDLTKLAQERTRDSIMSVAQLLDDDKDMIPTMMLAVACDLIDGTVVAVRQLDRRVSNEKALGQVLAMLIKGVGRDRVIAAAQATAREK